MTPTRYVNNKHFKNKITVMWCHIRFVYNKKVRVMTNIFV